MRSGPRRQGILDVSTRWRLIKSRLPERAKTGSSQCRSQSARGRSAASRNGVWEHLIRDNTDDARYVEYCHINPLKHGLVERVRDWPHSSFHRNAEAGIIPLDWAWRY
jgi:putative transposase